MGGADHWFTSPLWPLYIFWVAGWEALPWSLLTTAMSPLFLAVPTLTRRSSLQGRLATPLLGFTNAVFMVWILGPGSGTEVFLVPCAALSALIFRRLERLMTLALTVLPLMVCLLRRCPPTPLHHYDTAVMSDLLARA